MSNDDLSVPFNPDRKSLEEILAGAPGAHRREAPFWLSSTVLWGSWGT
ncbi:MAG: hypothetical protein MUE94_06895 [Verrucomicrobia bacterium]|jgi:hypothetical protein|nr:hypothetical protein [Verrucomicrobiota bacterium]